MLVDNASELRDCEAVAKTLGDRCGHTALCWRPARLVRVLRILGDSVGALGLAGGQGRL